MSDLTTTSRLRIGQRLALSFGATLLLLVAVAALSLAALRQIGGALHDVTDHNYVKVRLVDTIQTALQDQSRFARNVLIFAEKAQRLEELDRIAEARKQATAAFEQLGPMVTSPEGVEILKQVGVDRTAYLEGIGHFRDAAQSDEPAAIRRVLLDELRPRQIAYMASLHRLSELEEQNMAASVKQADRVLTGSQWLVAALSTVAAVIALAAGTWTTRSIQGPLQTAVGAARRVAAGDLTGRIAAHGRDETAQLLGALGDMTTSLRGIVDRVRLASDSIATGSSQIANGNADLSQRTEEQASNLQQTAASMEQLTATVRTNAETADEAARLASEASGAAEQGGQVMGEVVRTMQSIASGSQRIAEITGVIDGIAFQTNILALNAAVEAARAGEQGRGFAVVASEVRALAQRSASAAREIKSLIGESATQVEDGTRLVGDAGQTMDDLVLRVRRVNELVTGISMASAEQSRGISQIGDAVGQLDQVTQQNAALVEESAAAAESLKQQAQALAEAVGAFRLQA